MALEQNNIIVASDVSNWYSSLNHTIGSYGGGIGQLSNPAGSGGIIHASDINNLVSKLNELKNDAYLKNATYGSYSSVSAGQIIRVSDWTGINSSISSLSGVKCRNNARHTNGTCGNGTCGNGSNTNGTWENGSHGNGLDQNGGSDFNNTCGNVGYTNGNRGNGGYSNGSNNNGQNTNGTKVDIWNANSRA